MSEIDTRKKDDDEISLVDILVVLIKHRRLILITVLIGVIISAGSWIVLRRQPVVQPVEQVVMDDAEGKIGISFNPAAPVFIREGLQIFFYDPHLYYDALRKAGYRVLNLEDLNMEPLNGKKVISLTDPAEKEEALAVINRRLINNQNMRGNNYPADDQRLTLTVRSHYTVEILFRHRDPGKLRRFLTALLDNTEELLGNHYSDFIKDYVSYFETYKINNSPEQDEYLQYRWVSAYLDGKNTILVEYIPAEAALVTRMVNAAPPPPSGRMQPKTVSVIIIAGFIFGAVFLAFAVEAFKNIRKDTAVRVKIQEALGKEPGDGA
jgi:hypothetical protein